MFHTMILIHISNHPKQIKLSNIWNLLSLVINLIVFAIIFLSRKEIECYNFDLYSEEISLNLVWSHILYIKIFFWEIIQIIIINMYISYADMIIEWKQRWA